MGDGLICFDLVLPRAGRASHTCVPLDSDLNVARVKAHLIDSRQGVVDLPAAPSPLVHGDGPRQPELLVLVVWRKQDSPLPRRQLLGIFRPALFGELPGSRNITACLLRAALIAPFVVAVLVDSARTTKILLEVAVGAALGQLCVARGAPAAMLPHSQAALLHDEELVALQNAIHAFIVLLGYGALDVVFAGPHDGDAPHRFAVVALLLPPCGGTEDGGGQDGGSARPAGAAGRRTGATAGLQVSCVVADNTAGVGIPTANVLPGRNTYIAYIPGRYT